MIKYFWYRIIFTPATFVFFHVLVSGLVFGIGFRNISTIGFIIILCLFIIWSLCVIKPIRKKIFYLFFQNFHINHMIGEMKTRYNKIVINKFPNTLDLIVDIQTNVYQGSECKKFDYLKYSKDIDKIWKSKNKERDILLFVQKLDMTKALNQEVIDKINIYNRKEKIKSIL